MKKCRVCKTEKDLKDFSRAYRYVSSDEKVVEYYHPVCKKCCATYARNRYKTDKKYREAQKRHSREQVARLKAAEII